MTTAKRFLWGGIGGLAPILATFLILEGEIIGRYLSDLSRGGSLLTLVGYSVRVVGLFIVGGLWASLHKSERDPKKLFQLGIVAPAMITGVLNASNIQLDPAPPPPSDVRAMSPAPATPSSSPPRSVGRFNTPPVATLPPTVDRDQPAPPPPDPAPDPNPFIKGLLGRP